jgi:hypothetical protein
MGQQETMQAQQNANDQWVATQRAAAARAAAKDEANRKMASAAEQETLKKVSPESQQANQQKAEADLNAQMLQGSPAAPDSNIALLGGGEAGADAGVQQDMAARVTAAARAAQGRIAALAGMTSYGGGYNDMGSIANQNIATGNEAIKLASDMRQGDTQTLGVYQAIQPVQYAQGSNIAGSLASSLAGIAGSAFGAKMKG